MPFDITLEAVANIVVFIAPGYFALQVYALINSKRQRNFSLLAVESIVYSLPIVAFSNYIWRTLLNQPPTSALDAGYALLLILIAIMAGALVTFARNRWPARQIAIKLGLGSPNEDFIKTQLQRIDTSDPENNTVIIKLKNDGLFSGTVAQFSRYDINSPMHLYISNLAVFDDKLKSWIERDGGLIVERNEIEYIETPELAED